jgi:hypothetical protein
MKLYESFYILQRYMEVVDATVQIIIEHGFHKMKETDWTKKNQIHYVTLFTHILLDVKSYEDEYDNHFGINTESQFKDRIMTIKRIAKPAMKKIKAWKGIGAIRNQMIAHNWRVEGTKEFIYTKIGSYDSPRTMQDLLLLQFYLQCVQTVIQAEFRKESEDFSSWLNALKQPVTLPAPRPDLATTINSIVHEINSKCAEEGRDYRLNELLFYHLRVID